MAPFPSIREWTGMGVSPRRLRKDAGGASRVFCIISSAYTPAPAPPPIEGEG